MLRNLWRHLFAVKNRYSRIVKATFNRSLPIELLETRVLMSAASAGQDIIAQPNFVRMNSVTPRATSGPTGLTPAQVRQAYGFNSITFANGTVAGDGAGTTIAIVDAYDHPNIASDLHQFNLQFGLPDSPFTKVNQTGGSSYPQADDGWAAEIALDVEWAHAIAPKAKILLVEARDASIDNLMAAVDFARRQPGVVAVSMSWGSSEYSGQKSYDSYFTTPSGHTGVSFFASSGDDGAPIEFPSVSPNVVSVGGTSLTTGSAGTYLGEVGWSGSGGGISRYTVQPSYQKGIVTQSTTYRTSPDVAYNSDPDTGYAVYDSYGNPSQPWSVVGGTSAAAPQWAAMVAIADQGRVLAGLAPLDGPTQTLPKIYALPTSDFHDVVSGYSSGSPVYNARAGYDLVTGRGTPLANLVVRDLVGTSTTKPTPTPTPTPTPVPAATHFAITASSTTVAGTAFNITVTALDASNNVVPSYVGTVRFTSSDGAALLPSAYTFTTADRGVHTFSGVTLGTAGTQTVRATDVTTSSILGTATVLVTAPSSSSQVVEGFDSWSLRNYYYVSGYYSTAMVTSAIAHDGYNSLLDSSGSDWIYRNDATVNVKRGDTISVWTQFVGAATGVAAFGFGATAGGTLSLVASPLTGQLLLMNNAGYGATILGSAAANWQANHWYRLEVNWGTSGKIVGKVYDSNGTTLLQTVTGTSTAITSGGIAFKANGGLVAWDTVRVSPSVNSFAASPSSVNVTVSTADIQNRSVQSTTIHRLNGIGLSDLDDTFADLHNAPSDISQSLMASQNSGSHPRFFSRIRNLVQLTGIEPATRIILDRLFAGNL